MSLAASSTGSGLHSASHERAHRTTHPRGPRNGALRVCARVVGFLNLKRGKHPSSTGAGLSIAESDTWRTPVMNRFEEACPFEAVSRAGRCTSCCSANEVPPCVAAYLSGKAPERANNVIPLRVVTASLLRKAA